MLGLPLASVCCIDQRGLRAESLQTPVGPTLLGPYELLGGPGLCTNTGWSLSRTGPLPVPWEIRDGARHGAGQGEGGPGRLSLRLWVLLPQAIILRRTVTLNFYLGPPSQALDKCFHSLSR